MPQQDDINIRVGVENDKEASQKLERLEKRIVTATERMTELQVKAIRESLTGINRITFEQNQNLLQIEEDLQKEFLRIQESGLKGEMDIIEASKELEQEAALARVIINEGAHRQISAENLKTFREMSKTIDTFVDRWGKGAKDLGVVWDRMQNEIALGFSKFIFRLIGEWDFGLKAMQAISSRGLSGVLFAPFEKFIFGGGGGANAAATAGVRTVGTPPFNPSALAIMSPTASGAIATTSSGVISTLPFDIASGSITGTVTGIPSAQGGATQGARGDVAFGGIGALLKNSAFLQTAIGGGAALGGLSLMFGSSPVRGALGGVLTSFGVLALANVLLTGVTAAATLGLSAAAGVLIASFMRGRAKRRAAGIEEDFIRQEQEIVERYKEFEIQFGPAIAQMEALKAQGMDTLVRSGLGRAGRRGARNLGGNVDVLIREVERIEQQREQRRMLLGEFALPEFMFGGPVSAINGLNGSMRAINSVNGGILAMLHPGEFVMRKEAVQAMGESVLATLNSSPGTGASSLGGFAPPARNITVNQVFRIQALDGASVNRWWRSQRGNLAREIKKMIGDRAL